MSNLRLNLRRNLRLTLPLAFVAATVSPLACLPGPESLIGEANLEVLVTGLKKNDRVAIDVDALAFDRVAAGSDVRFFLTVSAGEVSGVVVVDRAKKSLCADFSAEVPAGDRITVGVNIDDADECPQLTRQLGEVEEVVIGECGNAACTTATTFDEEGGVVVVVGNGEPVRGAGRDKDRKDLIEDILSDDADELFATGICEPLGGPPRESVRLTRVVESEGGGTEESVDVSNCRGGIAARIRSRLALLRDDVLN